MTRKSKCLEIRSVADFLTYTDIMFYLKRDLTICFDRVGDECLVYCPGVLDFAWVIDILLAREIATRLEDLGYFYNLELISVK